MLFLSWYHQLYASAEDEIFPLQEVLDTHNKLLSPIFFPLLPWSSGWHWDHPFARAGGWCSNQEGPTVFFMKSKRRNPSLKASRELLRGRRWRQLVFLFPQRTVSFIRLLLFQPQRDFLGWYLYNTYSALLSAEYSTYYSNNSCCRNE